MNKMYVCVVETPDEGKTVSRIYTRLDDAREWMRNRFLDFTARNDGYAKKDFVWSECVTLEGNVEWMCWYTNEAYGWRVVETPIAA